LRVVTVTVRLMRTGIVVVLPPRRRTRTRWVLVRVVVRRVAISRDLALVRVETALNRLLFLTLR